MHERRQNESDAPELNTVEEKVEYYLQTYIRPYWPLFLIAVLLVIVSVMAILKWRDNQRQQLAQAFAEVQAAENVSELQSVADKYKNQPPGELAAFKAARQLYEDGQYVEAANAFATFAAHYKKSNLTVDALLGWAYCLENDGRFTDAQAMFLDVTRNEDASAEAQAEAYCGAGRTALALEEPEKARQYYESAVTAVDAVLYHQKARQMLRQMQTTAVVDAPAAEDGDAPDES